MKKTINFEKIDFEGKGKRNLVTVTIEYKEKKEGQKVLSISGGIWNSRKSDVLSGGQNLNTIKEYIKTPLFNEIYRLWKNYHLNDMHPECTHQKELGWNELASKKVEIYEYKSIQSVWSEQRKIKENSMNKLSKGETVKLNKDDIRILNLPYTIKTHKKELNEDIKQYYKLDKTEIKTLNWLNEKEHPEGVLSKKCPVCNYKYGTKWNYIAIPEEDEKIIYKILKGEVL